MQRRNKDINIWIRISKRSVDKARQNMATAKEY
jgi:hypothetical protein